MKVITSIFLTLFLCGFFPLVAISAKDSEPGMKLIRELGCKGCHMIYGKGGSSATDLTEVGSRLTAAQIEEFLSADPATRTKDFMPSYNSLTKAERQLISECLYNLH